jgi:hypothetical protein
MPLLMAIRDAQEDRDIVASQGPRPEYLAAAVGMDEFTALRTLQDLWDAGFITGAVIDPMLDGPEFYVIKDQKPSGSPGGRLPSW